MPPTIVAKPVSAALDMVRWLLSAALALADSECVERAALNASWMSFGLPNFPGYLHIDRTRRNGNARLRH